MNATKIETVTCKRSTPAVVDGEGAIFNSDTYNNATLYVPKGSVSLYYTAPDWMRFLNIQELDEDGQTPLKGDVNGDGRVNVSDVTTLVNMILGIVPKDVVRGDLNGDGRVNVSDVTTLVNIILGIH